MKENNRSGGEKVAGCNSHLVAADAAAAAFNCPSSLFTFCFSNYTETSPNCLWPRCMGTTVRLCRWEAAHRLVKERVQHGRP